MRARRSTAPRSSCYTHHSARPRRDADVLAVRLSHLSQLPSYLLQDLGESAVRLLTCADFFNAFRVGSGLRNDLGNALFAKRALQGKQCFQTSDQDKTQVDKVAMRKRTERILYQAVECTS